MRAAVAAALAAGFLLVAAGCGTSSAATSGVVVDAAQLVPPSALAFAGADANLDSTQWGTVKDLFGPIELPKGLDYQADVKPALGDQLNVAVLGVDNGKPEAIAIVKSDDAAKLKKLAAMFDQGDEHYTVQQIADWSVVADSAANFQAVRNASTGTSLADTEDFKQAVSQLGGSELAFAYANGAIVQKLKTNLRSLVGTPRWLAARVVAGKDDVRLDVHAIGGSEAKVYKAALLEDVPSGAALAVSFKNVNELIARIQSQPALSTALAPFLTQLQGITGEGVLYVVPGALLPVVTLEVRPQDPDAAAKSMRAIASRVGSTLPLHVKREGSKVLLTNAAGNPGSSGALVDDKQFKDALAAADVPDNVTWLAYADIRRLRPLIEAFSALVAKGQQQQQKSNLKLDKLGTLVAYGARTGSSSRLVVRVTQP
jgi:hypothetical protein